MRRCLVLLLVLLVCAVTLSAQTPVGQIFGVVKDASGAVVPGVTVVIEESGTGRGFRTVTNETGDFLARALPPGDYSVSTEVQGFKKAVRRGITVTALQNVRVDLALEVGTTTQSVVVTADAPLVDTRSPTVGATVNDVLDVPLAGRNVVNTLYLTPGLTDMSTADTGKASYNQQRANINGGRAYNTNMQLDGAQMYYAHRGQGLLMPPPDAIEEVKLITSGMSAEYSRGTSVMSAVVKSGTNNYHGSLYEWLRNDKFDGRKFFDPAKAMLRYNQFGGTIGGPVLKDKLFFFGSYQGTRIAQQASNSTAQFPPTDAERQGNFSSSLPYPIDPLTKQPFPDNQIPQSRWDPVAVKLIALVPGPSNPNGSASTLQPSPAHSHQVVGKFDYNLTQRDRLSFRYYYDYEWYTDPFANNGMPGFSIALKKSDMRSQVLNYTRTWTPNLISVMTGSYTHFVYDEGNSSHQSLADLGAKFTDGCPDCAPRLPFITVNGRFTAQPGRDQQRAGRSYDFAANWSWQHGRHEVKWGAETLPIGFDRYSDSYSSGRFTFDGSYTKGSNKSGNPMADLLLGQSVKFTQNSNSVQGGTYYIHGFFAQDNWKATKRLTLNLGLRWEIYTPWRDDQGQMTTYIPGVTSQTFPTAPVGMVFQTDPQFNYVTDKKNFGPRVGFAWDVFGDGKTSIRGGYGIMYDGIVAEVALSGNQPFSLGFTNNNPGPLSNPYANVASPFPYTVNPAKAVFTLPAGIQPYSPGGLRPQYVENINFTIERQLSPTWTLQSSYIANLGHRLVNAAEADAAVYGPGATTKNTDNRRPLYPSFASITAYTSDANSSYHAWQSTITKRLGNGLSVMGYYTWSKALDICTSEVVGGGGCGQQDPNNRNGSRGLGDADRTHIATVTYTYALPLARGGPAFYRQVLGGWNLSGIHQFRSGLPFTVTTDSDNSLTGIGLDRPNLVGDPNISGSRSKAQQLAQWFNPAAFVPNSTGQFGFAGRNILRGPGSVSWDASFYKDFRLFREGQKLQFRANLVNILNHAMFANPNASLAAPKTMGVIGSTVGNARVISFNMHVRF